MEKNRKDIDTLFKEMEKELDKTANSLNDVVDNEMNIIDAQLKAIDKAVDEEIEEAYKNDPSAKRIALLVTFLTIGALGVAYKWAEYKGYINLGETHKIESSHKLYEHNINKEIDSDNRHK